MVCVYHVVCLIVRNVSVHRVPDKITVLRVQLIVIRAIQLPLLKTSCRNLPGKEFYTKACL